MRNKPLDDITKKESSHNSAYKNGPYGQKEHIPREEMILDLIRRKIKGSVGKYWNDVRNKLRMEVPKRLHHNIDSSYITLDCIEKDGKVYAPIHQRGGFYGNRRYYVAQDGIIKKVKDEAKKKRRNFRKKIKWAIIGKRTFVKSGEFWEELFFYEWFGTTDDYMWGDKLIKREKGPFDIWFQQTISQEEAIKYWGAPIYCFKKLQCNKAEIRRITKFLEGK